MKLSTKSKEYIVPEYSLTGDLISFLTCNLQYRYQNRGTLPPSTPIQLWFGEFIHGVMEESYLKWEYLDENSNINPQDIPDDSPYKNQKSLKFPWNWMHDIRPIEEMIESRLKTRGLVAPRNYYDSSINIDEERKDEYNPRKMLYSARAEAAINIWGPHLFPLINNTEMLIKGIRDMPDLEDYEKRSDSYTINGVLDVLSYLDINYFKKRESIYDKKTPQANLEKASQVNLDSYYDFFKSNRIYEYLFNNSEFIENMNGFDKEIKQQDSFEIITDYKGMKRPSLDSKNWKHHEQQILTYAWLRNQQNEDKHVVAGIIFYLNELVPSNEDLMAIKTDLENNNTDVSISKKDEEILFDWNPESEYHILNDLSDKFKIDRSIRIIPISKNSERIENALSEFDSVVEKIEESILKESNGIPIKHAWNAEAEKRTCSACDFKTFCNKHKSEFNNITIP